MHLSEVISNFWCALQESWRGHIFIISRLVGSVCHYSSSGLLQCNQISIPMFSANLVH